MPVFTTNFSKSTELIIRYKANITLKIFFAQKRATEMILLLCYKIFACSITTRNLVVYYLNIFM